MRIREVLRRFVDDTMDETQQVVQSRRYKWLSAIFVVLSIVAPLHVFEPGYWQMRRVRRHIEDIGPQWDAFKRSNPEFATVKLFPSYHEAYGVMLSASGRVITSKSHPQPHIRLDRFMRGTQPPSSAYVDVSGITWDRPPSFTARQIQDRLQRLGFQKEESTVNDISFVLMRHADGRRIAVPNDEGVSVYVDTLREILRASDVDENDFFQAGK